MGWLSLLFFGLGAVAFYLFVVCPALKKRPAFVEFYMKTDSFWSAVWLKLSGLKTKLSSAFLMVAGALVELHDYVLPYITDMDWGSVVDSVPRWVWPVVGIALSMFFGWLGSVTQATHERALSAAVVGVSAADAVEIAVTTSTPTEAAQVAVDLNDLHTWPRAV